MTALVVWVMPSDELLGLLRRAHAGEDPELIVTEHYANSCSAADDEDEGDDPYEQDGDRWV